MIAANYAWQRRHPEPLPYFARWVLDLPRPYLAASRLRAVLDPQPGEAVLDVGAGTGYYSLAIAAWVGPQGRVSALDLQAKMLTALTRRARRRGIVNVEAVQAGASGLPYADGSFDAALLAMTLGEIGRQRDALGELRRVLKPAGRLVVAESPFDPHFVPLSQLRQELERCGFRLRRSRHARLAYFASFSPAATTDPER